MKPVLIDFGYVRIYSYGLFLALAFIVALFISRKVAKEKGIDPDLMYNLVFLSAISGVAGGRLTYVFYHWNDYASDPISIFYLWQGGLSVFGGFALALVVDSIWVLYNKLSWLKVADVAGVAMPLGIAIARIGCFLNGCCYGVMTNGPFGVVFPALGETVKRHPTQIYELIYSLLIFSFVWVFRHRTSNDGDLFFSFLISYSFFRFLNEFIRVNPPFFLGLTGSQWVSLLAIVASLSYFLIWRGERKRKL